MLEATAPACEQERALAGLRVLVVDDDEDVREILRLSLEHLGVRVALARSAREALDEIERAIPDVLLSDLAMPEEDGCALIRRVRERGPGRGAELKAAAVTAQGGHEQHQRALGAGFDLCMRKPFDIAALRAMLEELLELPPRSCSR